MPQLAQFLRAKIDRLALRTSFPGPLQSSLVAFPAPGRQQGGVQTLAAENRTDQAIARRVSIVLRHRHEEV